MDPAGGKLQIRRGYWSGGMKVKYGVETDTLTVIFRDVPVAESDEEKPGGVTVQTED
ncbi:MAG TPA: hypothetical protein VF211_10510 [Burkholderiales bacterium]